MELLQSKAFMVPLNNSDGLKMWPKSKNLETIDIGQNESFADVP